MSELCSINYDDTNALDTNLRIRFDDILYQDRQDRIELLMKINNKKYGEDKMRTKSLLVCLNIEELGEIMIKCWQDCNPGKLFGGRTYESYWSKKLSKLQLVRNPYSHPLLKDVLTEEDKTEARKIIEEFNSWL